MDPDHEWELGIAAFLGLPSPEELTTLADLYDTPAPAAQRQRLQGGAMQTIQAADGSRTSVCSAGLDPPVLVRDRREPYYVPVGWRVTYPIQVQGEAGASLAHEYLEITAVLPDGIECRLEIKDARERATLFQTTCRAALSLRDLDACVSALRRIGLAPATSVRTTRRAGDLLSVPGQLFIKQHFGIDAPVAAFDDRNRLLPSLRMSRDGRRIVLHTLHPPAGGAAARSADGVAYGTSVTFATVRARDDRSEDALDYVVRLDPGDVYAISVYNYTTGALDPAPPAPGGYAGPVTTEAQYRARAAHAAFLGRPVVQRAHHFLAHVPFLDPDVIAHIKATAP
jgi:hypothetical protein